MTSGKFYMNLEKRAEKYSNVLEEMHREIEKGKKPLDVIREYSPMFEERDSGRMRIAYYLSLTKPNLDDKVSN